MQAYTSIAALAISIISLLVAIYYRRAAKNHSRLVREKIDEGLAKASLALDNSNEAITSAKNGIELMLNSQIEKTKIELTKTADKIRSTSLTKKNRIVLLAELKASIENYLNQYENYCDFYQSDSIDKDRFIRQRHIEIVNLVEGETTKEYFLDLDKSTYTSTVEVYREIKKLNANPSHGS